MTAFVYIVQIIAALIIDTCIKKKKKKKPEIQPTVSHMRFPFFFVSCRRVKPKYRNILYFLSVPTMCF